MSADAEEIARALDAAGAPREAGRGLVECKHDGGQDHVKITSADYATFCVKCGAHRVNDGAGGEPWRLPGLLWVLKRAVEGVDPRPAPTTIPSGGVLRDGEGG